MGREKQRHVPAGASAGPKERHKRAQRTQHLEARKPPTSSKHHSYFELVENTDKKKKKLDFQITTKTNPPPGFDFVPIGNPKLTTACKDLSRAQDAMIFIVSNAKEEDPTILSHHVHRTGHYIRQAIVEEAKAQLADSSASSTVDRGGEMPTPQEYAIQADGAIRDLFPRIPNTDRTDIVNHAFNMNLPSTAGNPRVGLSWDLPLHRRVQLAVLAHIRHMHTRYDQLLKETSWQNARKVVEPVCLDILVKWRGDEETGRDQIDEILREVVVISDSEGEGSSDEEEDRQDFSHDEMDLTYDKPGAARPQVLGALVAQSRSSTPHLGTFSANRKQEKKTEGPNTAEKKLQRGFKRYERAREAWDDAVRRRREQTSHPRQVAPSEPRTFAHPPTFGQVGPQQYLAQIAGMVPYDNGYVPQALQTGPPADFVAQIPLATPRRPGWEEVMSGIREPANQSQPMVVFSSPPTNRFQDMLVRSVEPASPETMPPSFVRTLPPRGYRNPPMQAQSESRSVLGPSLRDLGPSDHGERWIIGVPSGRRLHSIERPTDQFVTIEKEGWQRQANRGTVRQSIFGLSAQRATPQVVYGVVGAAQPGERANPIHLMDETARPRDCSRPIHTLDEADRRGAPQNSSYMVDRGGFYERVVPSGSSFSRDRPAELQYPQPNY